MLDEQMQDSGRRKRWKVAYNLLCHQVKATPARVAECSLFAEAGEHTAMMGEQ